MEKNRIPGLTVGFIKDDYIWVKGFGFADLENKVLTKAESSYRLASVQKSMTAAAILQSVEHFRLSENGRICDGMEHSSSEKWISHY